jgi:uncharacterized protein (DUF1499 family)
MRVNPKSLDAAALLVAVLAGIVLLLSGPGYRLGAFSLPTAFMVLRWAAYGSILAVVLAAAALWRARGHSILAPAALVIGLLSVIIPVRFQRAAAAAPPIHDITTDTASPPVFVAVVPLRAGAANTLEYSQEVARQQRESYPEIKPLILEMPAPQVLDRAVQAARDAGWTIVATDADAGRIEATDTTTFFGFTDDIVVRLTSIGTRTVVDVRSVSRVGRGDAGTNARRVREYLESLSRR